MKTIVESIIGRKGSRRGTLVIIATDKDYYDFERKFAHTYDHLIQKVITCNSWTVWVTNSKYAKILGIIDFESWETRIFITQRLTQEESVNICKNLGRGLPKMQFPDLPNDFEEITQEDYKYLIKTERL